MKIFFAIIILTLSMVSFGCHRDPSVPTPSETNNEAERSGGVLTVFDASSNAYGLPASALNAEELGRHLDGDGAFEQEFVTAPAPLNSGLGPVYNAIACVNCHLRDGRSRPLGANGELLALLMRLSLPGQDGNGRPLPVPHYGFQLQQKAVFGKKPEGKMRIQTVPRFYTFADGQTVKLEQPSYFIDEPYVPLPIHYELSPRQSRPVFGLGLLEALDETTLMALADESDADGDGISGRPNYVWDDVRQNLVIGRFGWKANQPNLFQQTARAYQEDMGITSPYYPEESSFGQTNGDPTRDDPEVKREDLENVTFYLQTLGVPARRNLQDERVKQGELLFAELRCSRCHLPKLKTGLSHSVNLLNNQTIYPYTDLLLHDMGEELADDRGDGKATGREWRTPPLWGIGLTEVVNRHSFLLHDGRAKNLEEAILWHGGEGTFSREGYLKLSLPERERLIAFLKSL